MGREEWLLAEFIESEFELAANALAKVDDLERAGHGHPDFDPDDDSYSVASEVLCFHIERCLRSIGALAERLGTPSITREARAALKPRRKLQETERYEGDIFSPALSNARSMFAPLEAMTNARSVTAQGVLRNILNKTAVIVGDKGLSPKNEAQVRNAVLEVCRYSFTDAMKELGIPQILKHSKGDIGIPELRTVVEFKFVDSAEEMKVALDGVYADMKNYRHADWDTFYGVFYMTGPFYVQDEVERQFEYVGAERTWTPIVVQGAGGRVPREGNGKGAAGRVPAA